jgi:hypothetical protein
MIHLKVIYFNNQSIQTSIKINIYAKYIVCLQTLFPFTNILPDIYVYVAAKVLTCTHI